MSSLRVALQPTDENALALGRSLKSMLQSSQRPVLGQRKAVGEGSKAAPAPSVGKRRALGDLTNKAPAQPSGNGSGKQSAVDKPTQSAPQHAPVASTTIHTQPASPDTSLARKYAAGGVESHASMTGEMLMRQSVVDLRKDVSTAVSWMDRIAPKSFLNIMVAEDSDDDMELEPEAPETPPPAGRMATLSPFTCSLDDQEDMWLPEAATPELF